MSKPWFGPRKFGFGVTPISWQGWVSALLVILVFTGGVLLLS
jgi:hypothetical protein